MKSLIAAGVLLGAVMSLSACANLTPAEADAVRVSSGSEPPHAVAGQPDAQTAETAETDAAGGKTRAEVYQELIDAERSGELESLNSTLYAH